jgi:hypothetical protein
MDETACEPQPDPLPAIRGLRLLHSPITYIMSVTSPRDGCRARQPLRVLGGSAGLHRQGALLCPRAARTRAGRGRSRPHGRGDGRPVIAGYGRRLPRMGIRDSDGSPERRWARPGRPSCAWPAGRRWDGRWMGEEKPGCASEIGRAGWCAAAARPPPRRSRATGEAVRGRRLMSDGLIFRRRFQQCGTATPHTGVGSAAASTASGPGRATGACAWRGATRRHCGGPADPSWPGFPARWARERRPHRRQTRPSRTAERVRGPEDPFVDCNRLQCSTLRHAAGIPARKPGSRGGIRQS